MKLKDCCKFQEGYVNPSQSVQEFFGGPIKWLRASDLNDGLVYSTERTLSEIGFKSAGKSAYLFKKDSLAISKSGTIGRLGILKEEMCGNRAVINIEVDSAKVDLYYVFYTLKYKKREILRKAEGSIQKNLYVSALETISLNHSDLPSQKRISHILSIIDKKIALNNNINSQLESMIQTIYDYWFVQFDFPNSKGVPYKSNGGKMVWNSELKREIPEGWIVKPLSSFCKKIGDGIHGTPEYISNSDYSFINGNNLKNGFIEIDSDTKRVSEIEYKKYFIDLNERTILLSINGTLGNLAMYYGEKVMLGKSSAYINCLDYNRPYCYQFLKSENIQKTMWNIATGSTIKNLSLESIKNLILPLPNNNLIERYFKVTEAFDEKRKKIFMENKRLSELRDWLLPMLMNGQVKVK